MHSLQFINDELYRIECIGINLVVYCGGVLLVFGNTGSYQFLDILFVHAQHLMVILVVGLLIIGTHFLLFNVSLEIFTLELIYYFFFLESLLMFLDFFRFYYVVD